VPLLPEGSGFVGEMRIPYRIAGDDVLLWRKGSGSNKFGCIRMLPALALDGRLITESDDILLAFKATSGP